MIMAGVFLIILLGAGALLYPVLRRAARRRTQVRLAFLMTRLKGRVEQLSRTTANKFPTDYQRLQQQVAEDMRELSALLRTKPKQLSPDLEVPAWDLVEEADQLLPVQTAIKRPENLETRNGFAIKATIPEIAAYVQNIEADDKLIRQKIEEKNPANRQELLAVHEANMNRFRDILDGYLKIKQSPKDYYQAEERLAKSRQALEKFDLDLDSTLRQLNEDDLMNFEVSLRLMTDETG